MKREQTVLQGSVLLIAAVLVSKILGAVFRIPLTLMLGGTGMGYFSCAYGLFLPVFSLSVTGINTAVSAVIAQAYAEHDPESAVRTARQSIRIFGIGGLACSLMLLILAKPFCCLMLRNPQALPAVRMFAPAVWFCCINAVLRGVHEGQHNMLPTAVSQVAEGIGRVCFGLLLCGLSILYADRIQILFAPGTAKSALAASAAVLGVTLSSAAGMLTLLCFRRPYMKTLPSPADKLVRRKMFSILLPVAAASLVTNLTTLIDLGTGLPLLAAAIRRNPALYTESFSDPADTANFCYGAFSGLAVTVFNLVPSVTNMLGKGVFPSFAGTFAAGNTAEAAEQAETVIRRTAFLAVPAGCGITALAYPILTALFSSRTAEAFYAASSLKLLGIAVIFAAISYPLFSMLQAAGFAGDTVSVMLWGAFVKLIGNLICIPRLGMQGAALSAILCYAVILILAVRRFGMRTNIRLRLVSLCGRSTVCGIMCGVTAYVLYPVFHRYLLQKTALVCTIAAAGAVYFTGIFLCNRAKSIKNYEICT